MVSSVILILTFIVYLHTIIVERVLSFQPCSWHFFVILFFSVCPIWFFFLVTKVCFISRNYWDDINYVTLFSFPVFAPTHYYSQSFTFPLCTSLHYFCSSDLYFIPWSYVKFFQWIFLLLSLVLWHIGTIIVLRSRQWQTFPPSLSYTIKMLFSCSRLFSVILNKTEDGKLATGWKNKF